MIVSFHPCFVGHRNIICAGRDPDASDLDAIKGARAIILPQGCRQSLYEMAKANCSNIFPNYDARFSHPGKLGQIRLFRRAGAPHPPTRLFANTREYHQMPASGKHAIVPPVVVKFDWGGEGVTVFFAESKTDLDDTVRKAQRYEETGQTGFLIQDFIPGPPRVLRVVVAGERLLAYWRVQPDPGEFRTSISRGGVIVTEADPELEALGKLHVRTFCRKTNINLAGFDLLFTHETSPKPLFLEINYFFGRKGLGGSKGWYDTLNSEIEKWLQTL